MRTIGLLGGMSWESSALYYRFLNQAVQRRLGGLHSAKVVLNSVEFQEIADRQAAGDWTGLAALMVSGAQALERAGAEALLICSNTMHRLAGDVAAEISIPLLHIVDTAAAAILKTPVRRPLLLATRFTVADAGYRARMEEGNGLTVERLAPEGEATVNAVIYDELCRGRVEPASKAQFLALVAEAQARGADGVILGCTELGMILTQDDLSIPLFDTTEIHAEAAVDFALADEASEQRAPA